MRSCAGAVRVRKEKRNIKSIDLILTVFDIMSVYNKDN